MFDALLIALGSVGLFTARAFLPAFSAACLLRFGPAIPWIRDSDALARVSAAPAWFTHDVTLVVLGALALLELLADKDPDARALLAGAGRWLKAAVAFATTMGLVGGEDAAFVEQQLRRGDLGVGLLAVLVATAVFTLAGWRQQVLAMLREADDGDTLGLQRLVSWGEDLWAGGGAVFAILFPFVMLALLAAAIGVLALLERRAARREAGARAPCAACGAPVHVCARACAACGAAVAAPRALGIFGQALPETVEDTDDHAYALVEKGRCPTCATRGPDGRAPWTCAACGTPVLADAAFARRYLQRIDRRAPLVLAVCLALSLLPVIGLIPGILYARTVLVEPLRRFLHGGRRFALRWTVRLLFFALVAIQWVPLVGGLTVPIIALVSLLLHRAALRRQLADAGVDSA